MIDTDGAVLRDTLGETDKDVDPLDEIVRDGVIEGIQIVAAKKYAQSGLCVT